MRSNFKAVFKRLEQKLNRAKNETPKVLANEGQKVFVENFKTESWNSNPWKDRQKKTGRPILIGRTRRLINSVRRSVRSANVNRIVWGTDVPYAAVHNFGEQVTKLAHYRTSTIKAKVRGNSGFVNGKFTKGRSRTIKLQGATHLASGSHFKMPQRKFMGVSLKLNKRLKDKMAQIYKTNLK